MSSQLDEDYPASVGLPDTIQPPNSADESLQGSNSHTRTTEDGSMISESDIWIQAVQEDQAESRAGQVPEADPIDTETKAGDSDSEQAQTASSGIESAQSLEMAAATEDQRSASDEVKASPAAAGEVRAFNGTNDAPALPVTATEVNMPGIEPTEDAALAPPSSGIPISTIETKPVDMPVQEVIDLTMSDDDNDPELVIPITKSNVPIVKKEPGKQDNHATTLSSFNQDDGDHASRPDLGSVVPHLGTEENMPQEDMLRIALANFNNPCPHDGPDGELDMPEFDSDAEDIRLTEDFQSLKKRYLTKKQKNELTDEDEIDYSRACNAEEERKQLRTNKCAYQYKDAQDHSMFIPEEDPAPSPPVIDLSDESGNDLPLSGPTQRQLLRKFVLNDNESKSGAGSRGGKSRGRGRPRKAAAGHEKVARDGIRRPRTTRGRGGGRGGRRGNRGNRDTDLIDPDSLFLLNNIIQDATANLDKGDQPVLGESRNKQHALNALIASIPADQRDLYKGEKVDLEKATRAFMWGTMKSDTKGGFTLKGMNSSLKHYQVLGTSFCRKRENSTTRPHGGIMSHEMGLGKTIMMIANILDGRQLAPNQPKATLIVVPSALITQWLHEIDKHVSRDVLQNVVPHRPGCRITSPRTLLNMDIVVTSYNEVMRSWPVNSPPAWLVTEQAKREWWDNELATNRGVLHRVKWHRVVLDEAQAIKNYESKTSEAICNLEARNRWAISGTPVQNRLEEFYPYFRFLRCDYTGTYELFKKNFCKRGSAAAIQRLQVFLSRIMIRKTHKDEMFGAPILKLPEIKPVDTIEVEFNAVERAIYQIVRERFWQKIKGFRTKEGLEKNYRTIFVLLLRLRQLVGSPLLIQSTLKSLLETEDFERLWQITGTDSRQMDQDSRNTIVGLQAGLNHCQAESSSKGSRRNSQMTEVSGSSQGPVAEATIESPGSAGFHFRKYLQALRDAGQWEEANARSVCHSCNEPPTNPHITACMHIYCLACIRELQYNAALTSSTSSPDDATCITCGSRFKKSEAFPARGFDQASDRNATPYSVRSNLQGRRRTSADKDEEDIDWFTIGGEVLQSAKTKGAVKKMEAWWAADETAKIIVFVQFKGLIKIFSRICKEKGWTFAFFHGDTSFTGRDEAIKRFSDDAKCKVLIASMKAGGVGLNLVAANRVIIMDLWWNQSVETQAFCRVFRIGQTREVEVARFVVKDTIDMDILQMQEAKTKEITSAMENSKWPTRLTTAELLKLFGPAQHDENAPAAGVGLDEDEGFIMVDDPYLKPGDDDAVMTAA